MAEQHRVSRATIERDGAFARAVDALAAVAGADTRQLLLARVERLPRQVVQQLATLAETDPTTAKDLLVAAFEAPTPQAAAACIRQATTCGVCHRPLTNPTSIQRGIGPICACERGNSGAAPFHHGESGGRFSSEMRVSTDEVEQHDTPPPMPETVVPLPTPTSTLDVPTLLRATAVYLEAIQKGLAHGAFAETFDQYGSLWDAVHDGCVHLLDMLDGEPDASDERASVETLAPPAPVHAPAVPTTGRKPGYGDLPAKVRAVMQVYQQDGITAGALAKHVDAPRKQVWSTLERLVKQGKAEKHGTTYRWVA